MESARGSQPVRFNTTFQLPKAEPTDDDAPAPVDGLSLARAAQVTVLAVIAAPLNVGKLLFRVRHPLALPPHLPRSSIASPGARVPWRARR